MLTTVNARVVIVQLVQPMQYTTMRLLTNGETRAMVKVFKLEAVNTQAVNHQTVLWKSGKSGEPGDIHLNLTE